MLVIEAIALRGQPMAGLMHATFDEQGGTIGRGTASTLLLPDPERHVSRTHATIGYRSGGFVITHTGTLNPLTVNGSALRTGAHARLKDGDEIKVGPYRLRAKIPGAPQRAPAAVVSEDSQTSGVGAVKADPATVLGSALSRANDSIVFEDLSAAAEPPVLTDVVELASSPASSEADKASEIQPDLTPIAATPPVSPDVDQFAAPLPQSRFLPLPETDDVHRLCDLMKGRRVEPSLGTNWLPKATSHMKSEIRHDPINTYRDVETPVSVPDHGPETDGQHTPPPAIELSAANPDAEPGPSLPTDEPQDIAETPQVTDETLYAYREPIAEPQPTEVAQTVALESLSATDLAQQLAEAFLRGARAKDVKFANGITPEIMETLGQIVRESVQGTLDLLSARTAVKGEIESSATVIVPRNNNPLKFSPTVEIALSHMLEPKGHGFMTPVRAMRDAYNDLRGHQLGLLAGMNAAIAGVLLRFRPQEVENKLQHKGMLHSFLPIARKARQWDVFAESYRDLSSELDESSRVAFGKEFRRAYEAQLAKLRSSDSNQAAR